MWGIGVVDAEAERAEDYDHTGYRWDQDIN